MAPKSKLDVKWVTREYRKGRSATDISREAGVSVSTVCRTLELAGIARDQTRSKGSRKPPRTTCIACDRPIKPANSYKGGSRQARCVECRRKYERNYHLKRKYGLSLEDYERTLAEQGGGCAVCGTVDNLHVDHDHKCCPGTHTCGKCVRGILCAKHNWAIGTIGEDYIDAFLRYFRRNESSDAA